MSQFEPLAIDAEVSDLDVPKDEETVEVTADATLPEGTAEELSTKIETADPNITTLASLEPSQIPSMVGEIESQEPNVGVYLYIAQNITIPKTVSVGVTFYANNSVSDLTSDQSLTKYASGGYTGGYSGPAWVDPEEVILNKAQQMGVIKSLSGNNKGSGGDVHNHFDFSNSVISGFKDMDDLINYANEKAYTYWQKKKGEI